MSSRRDGRRALGTVISVTAERFLVELNTGSDSFTLVGFDGQHYVARIGSYVLIPVQVAYVVAEVVGLRARELSANEQIGGDVEDSLALKSAKFLDVVPVGMLPFRDVEPFRFGVPVFPPLYAEVLYAQAGDLDRILDVTRSTEPVDAEEPDGPSRYRAFDIGKSVIFEDYPVKVRVDEFFGGHSAVLGNTGSGKSCTVASIVQSIFEKRDNHKALGASFVFFDTNGEYQQAFDRLPPSIGVRYAKVPGVVSAEAADILGDEEDAFRLPHWFLTHEEWELLLRASDRTQRPVLRTALGLTSLYMGAGTDLNVTKDHVLASAIQSILLTSENDTSSSARITALIAWFGTSNLSRHTITPLVRISYGNMDDRNKQELLKLVDQYIDHRVTIPDYRNTPFKFEMLGEALELAILYEESHGNRSIRDYCSSLLTRYKFVRNRSELAFMRLSPEECAPAESDTRTFVESILGFQRDSSGALKKTAQISILNLSDVEDEVIEVLSAVTARLIFEYVRRLPARSSVPVNLVLEEAHRYISEATDLDGLNAGRIFERIAKEGRKYGIFIMIASQRPSELSKTVLSQCSNFVVHRIQNPEDLSHVRRMTPYISDSVLSRLPSLPKQHALIFGNSVTLPTTFKVREASPTPKSDDARIRELWFTAGPPNEPDNDDEPDFDVDRLYGL
ncbi:ATP-binding protein [Arthrobacter sp. RAF14]|uniref:ATP-binding protein n=1 Tax=Arthrobacter sp. RAF14 TaxID=3233051 RepID=UPI003F9062B4